MKKKTVVNKSTTLKKNKCLFCKRSQRKVKKKQQLLIIRILHPCEDSMKNTIMHWQDQKLVLWIWKCRISRTEILLSPQMSIGIYISVLKAKIRGPCHSRWHLLQHIFIFQTRHRWNPTEVHYFPSWYVLELLHRRRYRQHWWHLNLTNFIFQNTETLWLSNKMCYYSKKKVSNVLFEASLDNEMVPSLLQGNLKTDDEDSTMLLKASRSPRQLLPAVKSICGHLPNVFTFHHYQNGQFPIPEKCMQFCIKLLCVNPPGPTKKKHRLALHFVSCFWPL